MLVNPPSLPEASLRPPPPEMNPQVAHLVQHMMNMGLRIGPGGAWVLQRTPPIRKMSWPMELVAATINIGLLLLLMCCVNCAILDTAPGMSNATDCALEEFSWYIGWAPDRVQSMVRHAAAAALKLPQIVHTFLYGDFLSMFNHAWDGVLEIGFAAEDAMIITRDLFNAVCYIGWYVVVPPGIVKAPDARPPEK